MTHRHPAWLLALAAIACGVSSTAAQQLAQPETIETPDASIDADAGTSSQGDFRLRPLSEIDVTQTTPEGVVPLDLAEELFARAETWDTRTARVWNTSRYQWQAPLSCCQSNYFEQPVIERYGQSCCSVLQPVVSSAHFFGTVVALPVEMAICPPCKTVYTLGRFRPGSPTPVRVPGVR